MVVFQHMSYAAAVEVAGIEPPRWRVGQHVFRRYYDALQFAEWQAALDDIDAVYWDASMRATADTIGAQRFLMISSRWRLKCLPVRVKHSQSRLTLAKLRR